MGDPPPDSPGPPGTGAAAPTDTTPFFGPGAQPRRGYIPVLRVAAGRDLLRFVVLADQPVEIGRDEGCGLMLTDASVSRRHARVTWRDDAATVVDLGSRNGTRVEGDSSLAATLRPGGRLEVGTVSLRLDVLTPEELEHVKRVLDRLMAADGDPLTGLLTRGYMNEELPGVVERCAAAMKPLSCAFLDVDRFKAINDGHGHGVGDLVLGCVSRIAQFAVRGRDPCVRYGGEEILIVLEGATEARGVLVAERLRECVEQHDWSRVAPGLAVTLSCGVARHREGEPVAAWLERADRALYAAKEGGRNRVVRSTAVERGHPDED